MSSGISNETIHDALQRAKQLAAVNSTGQKRPLNDDLNFHLAKRPSGGLPSNMAGMAMGGPVSGDAVTETMDIPNNSVGLVIGRGGEQITNIQQQAACRVQMASDVNTAGCRTVTLQGPKHCIDKARKMINDVLERSRVSGGAGGTNGGGAVLHQTNGNVGQYITTELLIPGPKCGLIIGKNGETIKGLQENIGVKMLLIQDNQAVSAGPKPLRITGCPDKVEQAKRVVEQLLSSDDGSGAAAQITRSGGGGGPRSIGEVIVPRTSVGIIIGKGGETIKRLAQETGAKIQFKPDDNPNTNDRCAVIQGTPDQINRATQLISDLVTRSAQGTAATEVFYMHVPANKTGLVIGKGGDTIKQVCAETGAHVELSREPPPNNNEKVFVIKGTAYQIHHVQHIIRIKVGDIPPGTPMPQFTGPGAATAIPAGANPYGPTAQQYGAAAAAAATDQFSTAAQWAAQAQNVGQDSAWQHYYNQQQQQTSGYPTAAAGAPSAYTAMPAQQYQAIPGAGVGGISQMQAAGQPQQHMQPQGAVQPQQQQVGGAAGAASGTPAINPSTGQPDYSAQWAEYYRTMGMHEQANLIESQMKQQQAAAAAAAAAGQPRPQIYYNS